MKKQKKKPKNRANNHTYKRKSIEKCVKVQSIRLTDEACDTLEDIFSSYAMCKNMFLERFCGIGNIKDIQSFITVRNKVRKEQSRLKQNGQKTYEEIYKFQGRFWVMALCDASMIIKSMWTNLCNQCKAKLRDNHDDLTADEREYCNYILSAMPILYCVLNNIPYTGPTSNNYQKILDKINKLPQSRIDYIKAVLKRLIRKYKPYPEVKTSNCILLDELMYSIKTENGEDYLYLMTNKKGTRLKIKLNTRFCYKRKGNIQLVFDRENKVIRIHKCIKVKSRSNVAKHEVGIDKGYSTLISTSDKNGNEQEYGEEFGVLISNESERINKKNTNKNYFYAKREELKKQLKTAKTLKEKNKFNREIDKIERNHLGKQKYNKEHNRAKQRMETELNYIIRTFMDASNPSLIVLEDLTFASDKSKHTSKSFNRKMSSWLKGILDERLIYIGSLYGAKTEYVNPAYTSQYCSHCGCKLSERYGKHHELSDCEICGQVNANINAAGNILDRKNDRKIMLYTPYKKVKEICDKRLEPLHAAVKIDEDIW